MVFERKKNKMGELDFEEYTFRFTIQDRNKFGVDFYGNSRIADGKLQKDDFQKELCLAFLSSRGYWRINAEGREVFEVPDIKAQFA